MSRSVATSAPSGLAISYLTGGFARAFRAILPMLLLVLIAAPMMAQEHHGGGEANLILPDLDQATFLGGIGGRSLLMIGLIVSALGLVFGLKKLLCIGDLIHSIIELRYPEAFIMFDIEPEKALKSRDQVFSQAAKSGTLLLIPHFPFPGLGRIVKNGKLFAWQPISAGELS